MNQDKLDVVKQEMVSMNINILGFSELKWMERVNLIQMSIISTIMGKNPLEEMWVVLRVDERLQDAILGCNLKNDRMDSVCFQGKTVNITVIQACAPTTHAREAEVGQVYEDLQDLLELTPKKDVLFIIGDWNTKVAKQELPGITGKFGLGSTRWSKAKANGILSGGYTGHNKTSFSNNTRDSCIHVHHQMVNTKIRLLIFFALKDGEALYSQ